MVKPRDNYGGYGSGFFAGRRTTVAEEIEAYFSLILRMKESWKWWVEVENKEEDNQSSTR